jgi:hypothetical protein
MPRPRELLGRRMRCGSERSVAVNRIVRTGGMFMGALGDERGSVLVGEGAL